MKVHDPQGQVWRVTRRWVPWRPRLRKTDGFDASDGIGFADDLAGIVIALVVVVVVALLAPFVLPFLFIGLELVLVLVVLPFAVLGRVLLGRKWTVEVRRGFSPVHEELTGTWNDAGVRIAELGAQIERGQAPPHTLVPQPAPLED